MLTSTIANEITNKEIFLLKQLCPAFFFEFVNEPVGVFHHVCVEVIFPVCFPGDPALSMRTTSTVGEGKLGIKIMANMDEK